MGGVRAKIGLTGQLDRRQPGNYFKPCHSNQFSSNFATNVCLRDMCTATEKIEEKPLRARLASTPLYVRVKSNILPDVLPINAIEKWVSFDFINVIKPLIWITAPSDERRS